MFKKIDNFFKKYLKKKPKLQLQDLTLIVKVILKIVKKKKQLYPAIKII